MMKRLIALLLSICCVLPLVACGEDPDGPSGNGNKYNVAGPNKTEIMFANVNGGIGSVWLEEAAEEYARLNAETSFKAGKKGVYINIYKHLGESLQDTCETAPYHIYTIEQGRWVPYNTSNANKVLDITEIVTDETREGGKLEDAIFESAKGNLKGNDGKYYGLPHYENYGGISYNRKIFNELGCFIADPADPTAESYPCPKYSTENIYLTTEDGILSAGPDGISGNEDDGMPKSIEELLVVMEFIKTGGIAQPIVMMGGEGGYADYTAAGIWGSLAGKDKMDNYFNSEGEVEICKLDANGNIMLTNENLFPGIDYIKKPQTQTITLTAETGYLAQYMIEKYYMISFLKIIENEGYWTEDAKNPSLSHYDAQMCLTFEGKGGVFKKTAMLVEATYWYNESEEAGCFTKLEALTGMKESELDVRMMPLPTNMYNEGAVARASVLTDISLCYLAVNRNIQNNAEVKAAVFDFIKFLYSEEYLAKFVVTTGSMRAIKVNLTDAQVDQMGNYYKRIWNLRDNEEGSNVVVCSGHTRAYYLNNRHIDFTLNDGEPIGGGSSVVQTVRNPSILTVSDAMYKLDVNELWVTE